MKHLMNVIALGALLTTAAPIAAVAQPPQIPGCPPGWVPATPPVNPQLGCLPGQMQARPTTRPALIRKTQFKAQPKKVQLPPPGCAPGWTQAVHPLNPQLGCLPTQIQAN